MNKIVTLLFVCLTTIVNAQCNIPTYSDAKYDEFDKNVNCEFGTTFEIDNHINSYFQVGWSEYYYINKGWYNDKYGKDSFSLDLFARINTCDGDCIDCHYCSSKYLSKEYKPDEWNKYLKKEINTLPIGSFSYIHFIAENGDDIKIYVSGYGAFSNRYSFSIPLNSPKYPRTIDYYNWLTTHIVKKVRFSSELYNNLDFDIPINKKSVFKDVIGCIENFKKGIKQKYSN